MKFSKKVKTCILSAALLVSLLVASVAVSAYDGTSDPLISLSYLQQYKAQQIDPQVQSLKSELEALEKVVNQLLAGSGSTSQPVENATYAVLQLQYGQRVVCGESCELILRAGTASVYLDPNALGGISDLTGAKDLANGENITPNHLLLVPRSDGRGVLVTSEIAYIMVRGEYTVE